MQGYHLTLTGIKCRLDLGALLNVYIKQKKTLMGDPNPPVFQLPSSFFLCLSVMCRPQNRS